MVLWYLLACGSTTPALNPRESTDTLDRSTGSCELKVEERQPEGEGVSLDAVVRVRVVGGIEEAELSVPGVAGHVEQEGDELVFAPEGPWEPRTRYQVVVKGCGAEDYWWFETAEAPVQRDLSQRMFGVVWKDPSIQWGDPVGLVVGNFLLADGVMLKVMRTEPALELELLPARQHETLSCTAPFRFASVDFSENPWFQTEATEGALPLEEGRLRVHNLVVEGSFLPDASGVADLRISALVDTRDLTRESGINLCSVASCTTCPGSNSESCVALDLSVPVAAWWPDAEEGGDCP